MSPLSRGIFIIVSGAAEWVWCFILSGILCTSTTALPDISSPPPAIFIGLLAKEEEEKKNEEGIFKLTRFSTTRYFWVIDGRWHALK